MISPLEADPTVMLPAISVGRAIQFAWPTFKRRFGLLAAIPLTAFAAWVVLEILVVAGQQFGLWWWAAAHLAFLYVFAGLEAGFLQIAMALRAGDAPTLADAFRHFRLGPQLLAGQVLYLLLVAIGLALLIVPGLYLGARCVLFGFCLVTGKADLVQSFRCSLQLSAGSAWHLLAIGLALLVFNVLGAAFLGLGLLVTLPVTLLILADLYQQLGAV